MFTAGVFLLLNVVFLPLSIKGDIHFDEHVFIKDDVLHPNWKTWSITEWNAYAKPYLPGRSNGMTFVLGNSKDEVYNFLQYGYRRYTARGIGTDLYYSPGQIEVVHVKRNGQVIYVPAADIVVNIKYNANTPYEKVHHFETYEAQPGREFVLGNDIDIDNLRSNNLNNAEIHYLDSEVYVAAKTELARAEKKYQEYMHFYNAEKNSLQDMNQRIQSVYEQEMSSAEEDFLADLEDVNDRLYPSRQKSTTKEEYSRQLKYYDEEKQIVVDNYQRKKDSATNKWNRDSEAYEKQLEEFNAKAPDMHAHKVDHDASINTFDEQRRKFVLPCKNVNGFVKVDTYLGDSKDSFPSSFVCKFIPWVEPIYVSKFEKSIHYLNTVFLVKGIADCIRAKSVECISTLLLPFAGTHLESAVVHYGEYLVRHGEPAIGGVLMLAGKTIVPMVAGLGIVKSVKNIYDDVSRARYENGTIPYLVADTISLVTQVGVVILQFSPAASSACPLCLPAIVVTDAVIGTALVALQVRSFVQEELARKAALNLSWQDVLVLIASDWYIIHREDYRTFINNSLHMHYMHDEYIKDVQEHDFDAFDLSVVPTLFRTNETIVNSENQLIRCKKSYHRPTKYIETLVKRADPELFCFPNSDYDTYQAGVEHESIDCVNAIGVRSNRTKNGTLTYHYKLEDGDDYLYACNDTATVVSVGNGAKTVRTGAYDDTIIMYGESTIARVNAGQGYDAIICKNNSLHHVRTEGVVSTVQIVTRNVEFIEGVKEQQEILQLGSNISYVRTHGGAPEYPDLIKFFGIDDLNVTTVVSDHTILRVHSGGNYTWVVNSTNVSVECYDRCESANHFFQFELDYEEIRHVSFSSGVGTYSLSNLKSEFSCTSILTTYNGRLYTTKVTYALFSEHILGCPHVYSKDGYLFKKASSDDYIVIANNTTMNSKTCEMEKSKVFCMFARAILRQSIVTDTTLTLKSNLSIQL